MASILKEVIVDASLANVWDAMKDVGALHTRLVPGFVVDTRLENSARIVTFANGRVVREEIVSVDDVNHRVAWTTSSAHLSHYNGSVQAFEQRDGRTQIVWIVDFLPDSMADYLNEMMTHGITSMKTAFDDSTDRSRG